MMTTTFTRSALIAALLGLSLAATALLPGQARAANPPAIAAPPASPASEAAASSEPEASAPSDNDSDSDNDDSRYWDSQRNEWRRWGNRRHFHQDTDDLVSVGHDANLPAGGTSDSVVAVFGSATSDGTARQDVVSVFGDTTVNGPAAGSAVAVLGNVSINADIGEDVVAVLGNVTLGPAAHVHGHVVSVLGTVNEDPGAVVAAERAGMAAAGAIAVPGDGYRGRRGAAAGSSGDAQSAGQRHQPACGPVQTARRGAAHHAGYVVDISPLRRHHARRAH